MIEKEVEQFVKDIQLAYDPTSNSSAIYNIDPAVLVFLYHLFNCSQGEELIRKYIDNYHISQFNLDKYSQKIHDLLCQRYSFVGFHNIKTALWKKLDVIFEDMKEVMDEDS